MRIGILGTGDVGQRLGSKLVAIGHEVMLGSRTPDNDKAAGWAAGAGAGASHGTFADAAAHGEVVFNCVSGVHTLAALEAAGADALAGKVLLDLSNPLDFSRGFPPTLFVCNDESLGERVQAALPHTRVVKTLNTVANPLMVDPAALGEDTALFLSGDDAEAKARVRGWLHEWFGWNDIVDLGDITTARGTEQWLALWVRAMQALGTPLFNLKLVRAS